MTKVYEIVQSSTARIETNVAGRYVPMLVAPESFGEVAAAAVADD